MNGPRALTVIQPWASAIAAGAKRIETRSWSTKYRGELFIHAAAGKADRELELRLVHEGTLPLAVLPLGAIIARCRLEAVVPVEAVAYGGLRGPRADQWYPLTAIERELGDYTDGRYAWLLEEVEPLDPPVPARGAQGLWRVPDGLVEPTRTRVD